MLDYDGTKPQAKAHFIKAMVQETYRAATAVQSLMQKHILIPKAQADEI